MPETESTSLPHRFPWAQAAFCAACLGMAIWCWTRYSCARRPAIKALFRVQASGHPTLVWADRYVVLRGKVLQDITVPYGGREQGERWLWVGSADAALPVRMPVSGPVPVIGSDEAFAGRVSMSEFRYIPAYYDYLPSEVPLPELDATRSRWHPASIAGLAVGAMGVFIFALYLRRWLRRRGRVPSPEEPAA
ncbi:MAG: hypothetical protein ACYS9X_12810 [Planctomycetota bacterium]|jgi:hypothetical protein